MFTIHTGIFLFYSHNLLNLRGNTLPQNFCNYSLVEMTKHSRKIQCSLTPTLKIETLHYLIQLKVSPHTEPFSSSPTKRQKVYSQSEQARGPILWKIEK